METTLVFLILQRIINSPIPVTLQGIVQGYATYILVIITKQLISSTSIQKKIKLSDHWQLGQQVMHMSNWEMLKKVFRSILKQQIMPKICLLYTSPSPRDRTRSRMPSSA